MQSPASAEHHLPPSTDEEHGLPLDQNSDHSFPSIDKDIEKGDLAGNHNNEEHHDGNNERQKEADTNLVGWDGPDDPQNPQNWPKSKKYTTTIFYATLTFCLTFSSSIFSTATMVTAKQYGVSSEVMTLGTSLFVFVLFCNSPRPKWLLLTLCTGLCCRTHHLGSLV